MCCSDYLFNEAIFFDLCILINATYPNNISLYMRIASHRFVCLLSLLLPLSVSVPAVS